MLAQGTCLSYSCMACQILAIRRGRWLANFVMIRRFMKLNRSKLFLATTAKSRARPYAVIPPLLEG